jgi:hypothetical protein
MLQQFFEDFRTFQKRFSSFPYKGNNDLLLSLSTATTSDSLPVRAAIEAERISLKTTFCQELPEVWNYHLGWCMNSTVIALLKPMIHNIKKQTSFLLRVHPVNRTLKRNHQIINSPVTEP